MKAHAPRQKQPQTEASPRSRPLARRAFVNRDAPESSHLNAEGRGAGLVASPASGFAHDFSRIPLRSTTPLRLQAKLTVNTPGDAYEQEADRISEQVMRMSETRLQRACACGGACGGCQTEQPGRELKRLQTKRTDSGDVGSATAPPIVHEVLSAPGLLLDPSTRGFMEPRFGHDLSHVRIHTNPEAAESARAVKAQAYTVGNNIVFGEGEYSPHTLAGRRLLAHELVHTLQQGSSAESAGVVRRRESLDIALRSPAVSALVFGSEILSDFAHNSHTLTAEHKRRLLALAKRLKQLLREHQLGTVVITGHTDATGDEAFNDRLGQERADAVAAFLRRAGVPATALLAKSAGESALRVPTHRREPRNRRVEIGFLLEPPTPSPPTTETETATPTETPVRIPRPENLCAEHPDICDPITTKPEAMQNCRPTNCSAYGDRFDDQPPDLQFILTKSFPPKAAAEEWFTKLDGERRLALQQIFNRLCQYGLLCQVRLVVKVESGEPPAAALDRLFDVPGRTPSLYFTSPNAKALPQVLTDTGRFCMAYRIGASQHPGPTVREISGSDSLHISGEGGDLMEAHIDKYSSVPEHPGSTLCPNEPTPAAVTHIGRELVPEKVRQGWRRLSRGKIPVLGYLDLAGVQVFPDFTPTPTVPQPEPANRADAVPPPLVGITLRGPRPKRPKPLVSPDTKGAGPDAGVLSQEVAENIRSALEQNVSTEALLPPHIRLRLRAAREAADKAGHDEEVALSKVLEAAEDYAAEFDAHDVALDLAVRMEKARRSGTPFVKLEFSNYGFAGVHGGDTRKFVVGEIRRIALLLRNYLPERAAGVNTIIIVFLFEGSGTREEIRLPGWKPREKGLFE